MPQLINKNKIYFYVFCFIFLTTITNQKFILYIKNIFLIHDIVIKIDKLNINEEKFFKFNSFINQNILLIKKEDFFTYLNEINFLQDINIKKKISINHNFFCKKNKYCCFNIFKPKKILYWRK